jgi:hypothetical protein
MKTKSSKVLLKDLKPIMRKALEVCDDTIKNFTVTSTGDSVHGAGSFHPYGYAFDVRIWGYTKKGAEILTSELSTKLRKISIYFDVVLENNHIHIEFDTQRFYNDFFGLKEKLLKFERISLEL